MENGEGPLESFQLSDVKETGKELAQGSHGTIVEVLYRGLRCAGKKIPHENLTKQGNGDSLKRIKAECLLLSQLRHPHIVQFLGIYLGSNVPMLVMEYLPTTLAKCLRRYGVLPEEISYSVLRDVALGLVYLHGHSPPVVHGGLGASEVLLTWDMTAKIADVGVARLTADLKPSKVTTATSPEASKKGDIYSFGVLMIHTISGNVPVNTDGAIKEDHLLMPLIRQCTNNIAQARPEASQVLATINEMMPSDSLENRIEILHNIGVGGATRRGKQGRNDSMAVIAQSFEIERVRLQLDELLVENKGLTASLAKQKSLISARDQEMAAKLMAKDQEIFSKQQELQARETTIDASKATIATKEATVQGLTKQLRHLQGFLTAKHEPHLLSPNAQLRWRQCAHLPGSMVFAQSVTIGDTVYFGSGTSTIGEAPGDCTYKIFKYDATRNKWSPVPGCPVVGFGMVEFEGKLTLVGGAYESTDETSGSPFALTSDLHVYEEETKEWKKSILPMPTARLLPMVMSYESRIVACGGTILDEAHDICVSTVEVYDGETEQWYRAEPLPLACIGMTSTIIEENCYLLGGFTDTDFDHPTQIVLSASLSTLIDDAIQKQGFMNGSLNHTSAQIWQKLPDVPRYASTTTNIGGCLLALGGSDERLVHKSGALHVYSPLTSSWLRIEDIPVECFACTVAKLHSGDIVIIGGMGHDEDDALKTVYRGSICIN